MRCPSWLPAEAKATWRRLAPGLIRAGILTPLDRATFCILCVLSSSPPEQRTAEDNKALQELEAAFSIHKPRLFAGRK